MQLVVEGFGVAPAKPNLRRHPRYATRWWGEFAIGEQLLECYVYNVSLGGAKLLVFGSLPAERQARLFIPPFGVFGCELRWSENQFVGVKFAESDQPRAAELVACAVAKLPVGALPAVAEVIGSSL